MAEHRPFVIQFVGYSNAGKTTLLTELISRLQRQSIRVGVIKHDGGHDFEWDQPGKDTFRYREAGAALVAIQSGTKTAFIEQTSVPLEIMVERMTEAGAEIVLVEGFKREHYPKVLVIREEVHLELLDLVDHPVAIASWFPLTHPSLPIYMVDDYEGIFSFILANLSD